MGGALEGSTPRMYEYGLLVLRLALAAVFVAHGAQKLFGIWGGGGLSAMAGIFQNLGLVPAFPLAVLVGVTEFFGGLLLAAGAYARYAAGPLIVVMGVAVARVHMANGFFLNWYMRPGVGHGFEFNMVLVAGLVCMILSGPGALSVDAFRARSAESEAAGRARLRTGNA
jgi:putative oxidoreductase